jgi:spore germination protein GerM
MRSRSLMALVIAASLAAGCGIPADRHPEAVPGGVVRPALGPTTTTPTPATLATLFFVQAEQLVPVVRSATRPGLQAVLEVLLTGPTEAELAAGLRTAVSPQSNIRSVGTDGSTAVIDLTTTFVEVGGEEQILALAQIVLTATAIPGITNVRFELEGQPVEVPRAEGTLSSGPLTASDYASLRTAPPPQPGKP